MFLVAFLFQALNLHVEVLAAFYVLVSISVRDIDVAVFAKGIQQKVTLPHPEPKLIAGAFRAEAQEDEREEGHHQRDPDHRVRQPVVIVEFVGEENLKDEYWQNQNVGYCAVDCVLTLSNRHLRRPYQNAAEDQTVQHHHE